MENEKQDEHPFGSYPDGTAISQHPSPAELEQQADYWIARASEDQQEVLDAINDMQCNRGFMQTCKAKDGEELIQEALAWWHKCYPAEVKWFMDYLEYRKQSLFNQDGWSKDKSMLIQGCMPPRIKSILLMYDPDFFRYDSEGRSRGVQLFYKVFKKANFGGS